MDSCDQPNTDAPQQLEMNDRPTLDVTNLECPSALRTYRRRKFAHRWIICMGPKPGKLYYVLRKYRKMQQELLGSDCIDDPDPFVPTYVFYCFTGNPPSEK